VGFINVWGLPIKTWTQAHPEAIKTLAPVGDKKLTA
jgi:hypothetical protein